MVIIVKSVFGNKKWLLFLTVIGLIILGIIFKQLSLIYTNSKDTYSGTHNRIDALGWGVLLGLIISYYGDIIKKLTWRPYLFVLGVVLFILNLMCVIFSDNFFYEKVVFHSVSPFCFFLMIFGVYYYDFSRWKTIRFIAYYSYNWYLWHPFFVWIVSRFLGITIGGLFVYMIISFSVAVLFTILVEERFLSIRGIVLDKIIKKKKPFARQAIN